MEARSLTKSFGEVRALEGVTFDVFPSEDLALIGQNGAGKSTLSKIVAGFVAPDEGTVVVAGRDVTRLGAREVAEAVAMVCPRTEHRPHRKHR